MTETTQELTVQSRAVKAFGLENLQEKLAELAELADKSKGFAEITNEDSYKQIHGARIVLKNERIDITKRGKAARDDANDFAKAVIAQEKRLIEIISPEEERLKALQDNHDDAIEVERQAKIDAELKRVEDIHERIAELRGAVAAVNSMGAPSSDKVKDFIGDVERIVVDESFDEFREQAEDAKTATLATLRELLAAATEREAEDARIKADREELEKLRESEEKRQAEERAKREAEETETRKKREAEDRKQREKLEAQRKKQAKEQARINADKKRLADEQKELERKKREEAERKAAKERAEQKRKAAAEAAAKKAKYPGDEAIINALSEHFGVPAEVATTWLTQIRRAA